MVDRDSEVRMWESPMLPFAFDRKGAWILKPESICRWSLSVARRVAVGASTRYACWLRAACGVPIVAMVVVIYVSTTGVEIVGVLCTMYIYTSQQE